MSPYDALTRLPLDPTWVLLPLAWATALGVSVGGALLIGLLRSRAKRRAAEAAHTASGQGSILVDGRGRVLETNGPARKLLWPEAGEKAPLSLKEPLRALLQDPSEQHHLLRLRADRLIEISVSSSGSSSRLHPVRGIAVRDVTEQHRGERHLVRLAHYDSLTGLGNRRLFIDQLGTALTRAAERGARLALLYIDLDRFKEVNDTLGHGAGDELLKTLSRRFRDYLTGLDAGGERSDPSVARLAGDEFAIIMPQLESETQIEQVCQDLLSIMTEPMEILDRTLSSSGSIGVAIYPDHAEDVEHLVKHADAALYVAKDLGRARYVFYEPSFSTEADRSHKIEQELRQAIPRGELVLHYQPKVELRGDTVAGFEALLRWYNRDLGFVGPKDFIPVAEDRGMISEIGAWCLNEACRQIRLWQDAGYRAVPVSVNVSSAQFRNSDLQRIVSDALVAHNVHPALLELELTESLLLENDEQTALALRDLRAIGIRVALDDFGTGYSALTYLNRFPLDVVKMDRGFLRDIEDSSAAAGIASAVVSMSHSLGLEVVAEGVDSPAQAQLLRSMECDQIQGFLYSPAIPSEEATRFLASVGGESPQVKEVGGASPTIGTAEATPAAPPVEIAAEPAASLHHPPRILVIDGAHGGLGPIAFRMTRFSADVHLVSELAEARLFVEQEEPVLDLVIAAPELDLEPLALLLEQIRKLAKEHVPRLLFVGAEPDEARREEIRERGADWVLWEPYGDPELRFFVNAARSNRDWKLQRQSVRVPIETIAWIRASGRRGAGLLTSLSRRGAFCETSDRFEVGQPVRLEFKIDARPISIFANVARCREAGGRDGEPAGIDVIFYEVDDVTDATLSESVEQLWMRYRA